MPNHVSESISEVLNKAVDGQLDDYTINFADSEMKGENFLGEITFASLTHKKTNEVIDLVIKKAFESLANLPGFNSIYTNEINFYEKIWPTLNKFQDEHSVGFKKIPKCYACSDTKGREKIVLEDLRSQHFQIHDKTKPLDTKHYEFIFKSYGTYHALSYAFREQHPEEFSKLADLTKSLRLDETETEQGKRFIRLFNISVEYVRDLFDADKEEGIYKTLDNFREKLQGLFENHKYTGDTPVLLHGDCWSNNLMFKYDKNGDIEDMRFLDFQLVESSSPVNDLAYSLYSGASKETLDKLNDLHEMYIRSFSETLEKLNCQPKKPYTLDDLKNEWAQYGRVGYLRGVLLWRLKLVDRNHIPNFTEEIPGLFPIAEEHLEQFHTRLRDLTLHFYENNLF